MVTCKGLIVRGRRYLTSYLNCPPNSPKLCTALPKNHMNLTPLPLISTRYSPKICNKHRVVVPWNCTCTHEPWRYKTMLITIFSNPHFDWQLHKKNLLYRPVALYMCQMHSANFSKPILGTTTNHAHNLTTPSKYHTHFIVLWLFIPFSSHIKFFIPATHLMSPSFQ